MSSGKYSVEDVVRSYVWLGHRGYTELNAYHADYRPGRENAEWNRRQETYPKIWYASNPDHAVRFVERYSGTRTVCFSLNPRGKPLRNEQGFVRSAKERDITLSQNLLLDFDYETASASAVQHAALESFIDVKANDYFRSLGLRAPVRASTGRGWHLLFGYAPIAVSEHPDVAGRLRTFKDRFESEFRTELDRLEARLDNTQDLRRMVRIYGTAKPDVGIVSKWYGESRVEDQALRDYILSLPVSERAGRRKQQAALKAEGSLPAWFSELLDRDGLTRRLWSGNGKADGTDQSGSGFDFSLVQRLLALGHRDIDDLATILSLRPNGSVRKGGKNEDYVRRTIANALLR